MWTIFKLLNLFCILVTSYAWFTSLLPLMPLMLLSNAGMIICLGFLPIQFKFDARAGWIMLALIALVLWTLTNENAGLGFLMILMYTPVLYLIQLPREYQTDLLKFVTKWIAILLIPGLLLYWMSLFTSAPSLGMFIHPQYKPFINHLFYIETTVDYGTLVRFNAFFLEPGHLAMVCVFLMMANKFDFKKNPYLWVYLVTILFSFSLAGYLLTLIGFTALKVNTLAKGLAMLVFIIGGVVAAQSFSGGDNAVNQLIIDRLKYDEEKGIQGNNRFFNNTDFEYTKAVKSGDYWTGVSDKANMELIGGAGYKIYILKHGLIGVLLVLLFYITLIPPHPNWHYTLAFLFIVALCFIQNAYPGWYSWLMPFVIGLSINSKGDPSDEGEHTYLATDPDI